MDIVVLGIDLGKNSCSVVGLGATGHVLLRRRMKRESILALGRRWSGCTVVMEACCGAHHLARRFAAEGHDARRSTYLPTSRRRRTIIVTPKQSPRRRLGPACDSSRSREKRSWMTCSRCMGTGTPRVRANSAHQSASGTADRTRHYRAAGASKAGADVGQHVADESSGLSTHLRQLISSLRDEWKALDDRIAAFDAEFCAQARTDEATRRLVTVPGIGSLNATALVPAMGNARAFPRGRDLAAWLGLVPRQMIRRQAQAARHQQAW
jgi:transposase